MLFQWTSCIKIGALKSSAKFTGNQLYRRVFFNKVTDFTPITLLKKRLRHRCPSVIFVKFLGNPILSNNCEQLLLYHLGTREIEEQAPL